VTSSSTCRGYLGTGSVDFRGLFRGLAAIDYSGPITFESFSSEVCPGDLLFSRH
jgi:D-psicose/D-tagatose/L-ribulose 3-epimerase